MLLLALGGLALTFGYFGPGLPQRDYIADHERFVAERSGLGEAELARTEQLSDELADILDREIWPILVTDDFQLGGTEVREADLPADQREAIERAVEAMDTSGLNTNVDALITVGFMPDRGSLVRSLTRLYMAAMHIAWHKGDVGAAISAYSRMRGLAHANAQGSLSIIGRLVSTAVDIAATGMLRDLMADRVAGEDMLEAFLALHTGESARSPWPTIEAVFEGERFFARDMLQSDGIKVPLKAVNPGAGDRDLGRLNERVFEAWALSGQERIDAIRRGSLEDGWTKDIGALAGMVAPAYGAFLSTEIARACHLRATAIALAIELYRVREGHVPASLDEIPASMLSPVPVDAVNDAPFRYVLDEDSDLGYTLYSVGFDGEDNDAAMADNPGDALHLDGQGVDFVFMPPANDD
ncbi:MAG: hypothetical protein ACIAQU_06950 [Phycisphaerales bacterium JB064]